MPDYLDILNARTKSLPGLSYKLQEGSGFAIDIVMGPEPVRVDEGRMAAWIPIADGARRDGVGDLLEVEGIRTERHRKNPLCLYDHGKQVSLPIGLFEDRDTQAYTFEIDPVSKKAGGFSFFYQGTGIPGADKSSEYSHAVFCEQTFHMFTKRLIRSGSIGYQVIHAQPLPPDPSTGTPQGLHLLSVNMLEGSLVVLPANQDTVGKGFDPVREILGMKVCCGKPLSPYFAKSLAHCVPCQTKTVSGYEGKRMMWGKKIVKKGGKYVVIYRFDDPEKPEQPPVEQDLGSFNTLQEAQEMYPEAKPDPGVKSLEGLAKRFRIGNTVRAPDGREGIIMSGYDSNSVRVRIGDQDYIYFMDDLVKLKKDLLDFNKHKSLRKRYGGKAVSTDRALINSHPVAFDSRGDQWYWSSRDLPAPYKDRHYGPFRTWREAFQDANNEISHIDYWIDEPGAWFNKPYAKDWESLSKSGILHPEQDDYRSLETADSPVKKGKAVQKPVGFNRDINSQNVYDRVLPGEKLTARTVLLDEGQNPFAKTGDRLEVEDIQDDGTKIKVRNRAGKVSWQWTNTLRKMFSDIPNYRGAKDPTLSCATCDAFTPSVNNQGRCAMFAATVGREMVCDAWVKRGATQIVGDLNWLKREGKEDVTIDMRGKSLPVSTKSLEIRKKYRPVKGLRKKLKNSSPGTSVLYVNGKDIAKAKKLAEGRGLKFTHTGTHSSGLDRIKLMGDDKAIEDIAKEFGRRRIKSLLAHGKSDIRQWWGSLRTELERALGPNMVHNPDEILDDYFGDAEGMQQQGKTPQQAAEEIAKRAGKSLPGKRGKGQSWWYNAVLTALGPLLGYDPHDIWDEYEDELEGMQQEGKTPQDAAKEIAKKAGKSLKDKKTKGRWMSPTHNVYHGDHQVGKTQANSDEEALEFAEGKWGEGVTVERIKKSFKGSKDISHNMHRMQVGDRVKFDDGPYAGKVGSVSKVGYTTVDVKLDGDGTVLAADTEDLSYQLQRGITVKGMEHKKKSWWWEAVKQALCVALGVGVGYASGSDALGIGTTAGCSTVMWKNERELEEMEEDGVSPQEAANKIAKKAKKSLMGSKNMAEMRRRVKQMEGEMPPEEEMGGEGETPPEGVEGEETKDLAPEDQKYSAEVLRRLHQDLSIILEEWDEMRGPLEHEQIDKHLEGLLQRTVADIEELEAMFDKHHPDATPLMTEGLKDIDVNIEDDEEEEGEESGDTGTKAEEPGEEVELDDSEKPEDEEPTEDEAVEGMSKEAKRLRNQLHKALRGAYGSKKNLSSAARARMLNDEAFQIASELYHQGSTEFDSGEYQRLAGELASRYGATADEVKEAVRKAAKSLGYKWLHIKLMEMRQKQIGAEGGSGGMASMDMGIENGHVPGSEADTQEAMSGAMPMNIKDHEFDAIEEAKKHLKDIGETGEMDDEKRMNSHHHHKNLEGIAGRMEKAFSEMSNVAMGSEVNAPSSNPQDLPPSGKDFPSLESEKTQAEVNDPKSPTKYRPGTEPLQQFGTKGGDIGTDVVGGYDPSKMAGDEDANMKKRLKDMIGDVVGGLTGGGDNKTLHKHYGHVKGASSCLKDLSTMNVMGPEDQERAKMWSKALEEVQPGDDDDMSMGGEDDDMGSMSGDMGSKASLDDEEDWDVDNLDPRGGDKKNFSELDSMVNEVDVNKPKAPLAPPKKDPAQQFGSPGDGQGAKQLFQMAYKWAKSEDYEDPKEVAKALCKGEKHIRETYGKVGMQAWKDWAAYYRKVMPRKAISTKSLQQVHDRQARQVRELNGKLAGLLNRLN